MYSMYKKYLRKVVVLFIKLKKSNELNGAIFNNITYEVLSL